MAKAKKLMWFAYKSASGVLVLLRYTRAEFNRIKKLHEELVGPIEAANQHDARRKLENWGKDKDDDAGKQ